MYIIYYLDNVFNMNCNTYLFYKLIKYINTYTKFKFTSIIYRYRLTISLYLVNYRHVRRLWGK